MGVDAAGQLLAYHYKTRNAKKETNTKRRKWETGRNAFGFRKTATAVIKWDGWMDRYTDGQTDR